ncbi:unnamed protein product [Echinostoma caproni]|uniref:Plastocyanin-like domain-containing protein n=1 Tax=Echinostoma caproni TaxID=27848 RepID=A0A183B1C5_9TREM|nr:unnamed protein product [Echinostoma caproni]
MKHPSPQLGMRGTGVQTVLRNQRITARDSPFRMHQTVPVGGQYYLRLDNSYSWMRVKRVRYSVTVSSVSLMSIIG